MVLRVGDGVAEAELPNTLDGIPVTAQTAKLLVGCSDTGAIAGFPFDGGIGAFRMLRGPHSVWRFKQAQVLSPL